MMTEITIESFGITESHLGDWGYLVVRNDYKEARMIAEAEGDNFNLIKRVDPCWDVRIDIGKERLSDAVRANSRLEEEARNYASYFWRRDLRGSRKT